MTDKDIDGSHLISDALWERIEPLLPPEIPKTSGGRPRMDNRKVMEAILYVLRTCCKWNSLPRSLGATSTVRRRFLEWRETGMFQRMWQDGVLTYDELRMAVWNGKRRWGHDVIDTKQRT